LKTSPKAFRAQVSDLPAKGIKEFFKALAPEKKALAAIRAAARKNGKSKISQREIDREIRRYRREHSPQYPEKFPHPPCDI
jgi:hypothetical protein